MGKKRCSENIKETDCHPELDCGSCCFVTTQAVEIPDQVRNDKKQRSGMRANGFTLIELLVVVLIIGILAAIALPQYQKAVRKTLYTSMLPIIRQVVQAQETYYLRNGTYASDWNQLEEISIPAGGNCDISNGPAARKCRPINEKVCICLGNRSGVPSVMIGFSHTSHVLPTEPSGYEYVFNKVQINSASSLNKGLYCRENNYGSNRTDKHCAAGAGHKSWYGSWFFMH